MAPAISPSSPVRLASRARVAAVCCGVPRVTVAPSTMGVAISLAGGRGGDWEATVGREVCNVWALLVGLSLPHPARAAARTASPAAPRRRAESQRRLDGTPKWRESAILVT